MKIKIEDWLLEAFIKSIKVIALLTLFWMMINLLYIILSTKVINVRAGLLVTIIMFITILAIKLLDEMNK